MWHVQFNLLKRTAWGGWLIFGLINPAGVLAKQPPTDDLPPSTGGQSAGSRGCGLDDSRLQQLIPPLEKTQTYNTTPTLGWYQHQPHQAALEFRIFQYDARTQQSQLVAEVVNPPVQRINTLSILTWPTSLPALKPDRQYIWQVEVVCDPNRPSGNLFADAPIRTASTAQPRYVPAHIDALLGLNPTAGYDILATMMSINHDALLSSYLASLQDPSQVERAWNTLVEDVQSSRSNRP